MIVKVIDCHSNKDSYEYECEDNCMQHRILKIVLNHKDDRIIRMMTKIRHKALGTNFNTASSSGKIRGIEEQNIKSVSGFLAEEIVYKLLQKYNEKVNLGNLDNISIELDNSNTSKNQIDIRVLKKWKISDDTHNESVEDIEIRSSFPFKSIENTICKTFDVLGYYINNVKIKENEKDYYLRLLFSLDYHEDNHIHYIDKYEKQKIDYNKTTINTLYEDYFDENYLLKKDLIVYFVGGATREMMNNDSISYFGTMESDIFNTNKEGLFRKIKLKNSLDSVSIIKLILGICTNEHIQKK